MEHYQVEAVRDGKWWALAVTGVRAAYTQARRLDQAEEMVRDMLTLLFEVDPDSFGVEISLRLADHQTAVLGELDRAKAEAELARAEVARQQQRAARVLVQEDGLTVRDAGTIMGLSHQRVAQLIHAGHDSAAEVRAG